jgi:predicted Zn finger-like uncharacterized protein
MDVRCDRCQTEYELDDDSVTEGGASVQCTTCGHTFVVGPNGVTIAQIVPTPPGGMSDLLGGPQAADWLLATEDGQTHRFRDLTTLQKWVVERKATRGDRVSQRGGPWRPLGEVGELAPFFDVVDQADWARSAESARGGRPRTPEGLSSRQTPTRQTALSRPGSRKRANGVGGADDDLSARLDSSAMPALYEDAFPPEEEKFQTMAIFRTQTRLKIAGGAGFVALAIVAAFIGFSRPRWVPFFKNQDKVAAGHVGKVAEAPRAADPTAPAAVAAPAPVAPTPIPAPTSGPGPRPAPGAPPAPGVDFLAASKPRTADRAVPDPGAVVKAKSYERLVADADRLMENGAPVRAQKLLDEALAMQPNGVAALSGSAYLLLDRHKPLAAIATFRRALGFSPEFAPALFGLGEAYRAQGELPLAAENYRKYIGVAPGGPDAPAARRQLKEIDSLMPRRAPVEAAPAPEAAKREEPAPPAAEPSP